MVFGWSSSKPAQPVAPAAPNFEDQFAYCIRVKFSFEDFHFDLI